MGGDEHDVIWLQGRDLGGNRPASLISTPGNLGKTVIKTSSSEVLDNYNPTEKN